MLTDVQLIAQAGGLAVIVAVLVAVRVRHHLLRRRVYRQAAAPLPGRTRDLPGARQ